MKILTSDCENPQLSSWKSRPFLIKILNCHHENLDLSSWKSWQLGTALLKIFGENRYVYTALRPRIFEKFSLSTEPDLIEQVPFLKEFCFMTVCSSHVKYAFQSESTLYSSLNVKELLAQSRRKIWSLSDCNGTRTHNQLSGFWFESRCSHLKFCFMMIL